MSIHNATMPFLEDRDCKPFLACFIVLYFCNYLNSRKDPADDKIIESDVANPFKMLSAYFIVAAINRPPPKLNKQVMLKSHNKLQLMIINNH